MRVITLNQPHMTDKKLPLYLDNTFQSIYGNFGVRLGALFLDALILSPIFIIITVFNSMRLSNYYYTFIISQIAILAYYLYLPVRYGATPGKLIMGLTILKVDGSAISYRESFLKFLPSLIIGIMGFVLQCYFISLADEETFNNLSWLKQANYLKSFSPMLLWIEVALMYAFHFSNLIVFISNQRKRSIGDQLAGTVSVYTRFLDKLKEEAITE